MFTIIYFGDAGMSIVIFKKDGRITSSSNFRVDLTEIREKVVMSSADNEPPPSVSKGPPLWAWAVLFVFVCVAVWFAFQPSAKQPPPTQVYVLGDASACRGNAADVMYVHIFGVAPGRKYTVLVKQYWDANTTDAEEFTSSALGHNTYTLPCQRAMLGGTEVVVTDFKTNNTGTLLLGPFAGDK
jgi:hypothetical protein